jgi:hypothetical protein
MGRESPQAKVSITVNHGRNNHICRVCHDIPTFQPSMSQCTMKYPLFASNYPRYDIGHTHIWIRCCAPAVNLPTCTADSLTSTTNTLTHACTANKQMSTHKLSPYAKLFIPRHAPAETTLMRKAVRQRLPGQQQLRQQSISTVSRAAR